MTIQLRIVQALRKLYPGEIMPRYNEPISSTIPQFDHQALADELGLDVDPGDSIEAIVIWNGLMEVNA